MNFRELGGQRTLDGRTIRHGVFLRSGGLHLFQEEELDVLREYGVTRILDFREKFSWKRKPDPDIGASHVAYDGITAAGGEKLDFTPKGFALTGRAAEEKLEKLKEYYAGMPFGYQAFHAMIDTLREGCDCFLFHCSKGKDRTGIAAIVLMYLLGADEDAIMEEYLLSNEYRRELIRTIMNEGRNTHPDDPLYLRLMFLREGVEEEMGRGALDRIITRCGSPENYARMEYGMDEKALEQLRRMYLE